MSSPSKIRVRREDDIETARELYELVFPKNSWQGDEHENWFAWEGDSIVGFASAVHRVETNTVYLSSAAVVNSHRAMGLQRRLIRVRVAWATRLGATAVTTYVSLRNYSSLSNLMRCGFRCYQKPHADDWHLLYRRLRRISNSTLKIALYQQ